MKGWFVPPLVIPVVIVVALMGFAPSIPLRSASFVMAVGSDRQCSHTT